MTRSLCLAALVAVFVAASPARAQDPPAEPKLTKSDLKRYRAAMAEAVRAAKKGKHAAAMDPLKPLPMLGPFARLEDFCRTAEQKDRTPCPAPGQGAHLTNVPSPYGEVLWFQAGRDACYVAFRVGQSWFVEPKGQGCGEDDE